MDYVNFVELVARSFAQMRPGLSQIIGVHDLCRAMDLPEEAFSAVFTAIQDLDRLGMVELDSVQWIKETQNTRAIREGASLPEVWPAITGQYLDEEQTDLLGGLVALAERPGESFADVEWVTIQELYAALGWTFEHHESHHITQSLEELGLVRRKAAMGNAISLYPTYRGVVRATKVAISEWQERLEAMVKEWETTTVEFKEHLPLATPKMKAEFARDVISLANTKASGRDRYLIIGYEEKTRNFTKPVDLEITHDRLEQILNSYADPAPPVRYFTVEHVTGLGVVGVLEVRRDPIQLPLRLKHGGGKLRPGQVFVRHGSQVEEPSPAELADLVAEGNRARAAM